MPKIVITNPWRLISLGLLILLIILGIFTFKIFWGSTTIQTTAEFTIEEGSSARTIWSNMVDLGFSESALPWYLHSWRLQAANNIKSGTYSLSQGERIPNVIKRFVAGDAHTDELSITYPEGFTLQQIAARTAAQKIGTVDAFIQKATPASHVKDFPVISGIPTNHDLEGYLFPDTYRVFIDDQPTDVIKRMLANFNAKFSPGLRDEAAAQGRSIHQIVTMASIVEREVISDQDMATVSGILWQRFDDGVGLDADATVRYALDKWDKPLTYQDLQDNSPYNTRKWKGLPPGPISNPGLRALQAAVRPVPSDYYYYLSAPSGETIFSQTLEEHNTNKAKYLR